MRTVRARTNAVFVIALLAASCASDAADPSPGSIPSVPEQPPTTVTATADVADEHYPEVVSASASLDEDGTWTVSATISSPYDTPERYADGWRVLTVDGIELAVRELAHDHAGEQPFTRSLSGVAIPTDAAVVVVEGRDQHNGWGGRTARIELGRP